MGGTFAPLATAMVAAERLQSDISRTLKKRPALTGDAKDEVFSVTVVGHCNVFKKGKEIPMIGLRI
jgi:hypothetical protein